MMPVLDAIFAELPAQLHQLSIAVRGKVDQALEWALSWMPIPLRLATA